MPDWLATALNWWVWFWTHPAVQMLCAGGAVGYTWQVRWYLRRQQQELDRFIVLNRVLVDLVGQSWVFHHQRHPIWRAWAASMGRIKVSVERQPPDEENQ